MKSPTILKNGIPSADGMGYKLIAYIVFIAWIAFLVGSVGWIFLASLSTTREIFSDSLLASGLHIENYITTL